MRLLIVKTSSMGDVVHALPVIADIQRERPGTEIDWLVEKPFAPLVRLHPGVRHAVPMQWRQWRRRLFQAETWRSVQALRAELRQGGYDLVIDLQGLLKSACWARATGAPVAGYDRGSIREPAAAWLYQRTAAVGRHLHAIDRCRLLAAAHLGYAPPQRPPVFGLLAPRVGWAPDRPYAVLIPNASRSAKFWPERHWMAVGRRLHGAGLLPVVLWGSPAEQSQAESIAAGCDGDVPPFLDVASMAGLLAGARQVVGLDTGFTHLAAALGRPTVGIYCDHEPGLAGITGAGATPVASVGCKGTVPSRQDVLAPLEQQLALSSGRAAATG